jgi:hypothetical protein
VGGLRGGRSRQILHLVLGSVEPADVARGILDARGGYEVPSAFLSYEDARAVLISPRELAAARAAVDWSGAVPLRTRVVLDRFDDKLLP